jgi:D-alanyl-D-alanine dipeptidase
MRHHAPDLAIAAFMQADGQPGVVALARIQAGVDRPVSHALDRDALGQRRQRALVRHAVHPHAIAADPAVRRQLQFPGQRAVVGQQQQPLAVQVEPPDADHTRQARRQLFEHCRAALRIAMRRHQADRLVIAP